LGFSGSFSLSQARSSSEGGEIKGGEHKHICTSSRLVVVGLGSVPGSPLLSDVP
jgi:hypothetical protein